MRKIFGLWLAASLCAGQPHTEEGLKADLEQGLAQKNGPRVLIALNNLDSFYRRQHKWAQEGIILRSMISYWSSNIGPDSIAIARYSADLGEAEEHAGDLNEAVNDAQFAATMFEKDRPQYEAAAMRARRILRSVLEKAGRAAEAAAMAGQLPPEPKPERPDQYPRLRSKREPEYTNAARGKRISGDIVLALVIDETGKPRGIEVIAPLGFGLDENAMKAVGKWKFAPAIFKGKPVSQHATVEVTFRLL